MVIGEDEGDMRSELGLTEERGNELVRITRSIVEQITENGMGRTSCVLLSISSRKDLTDTEKVICSFIFSCGCFDVGEIGNKPNNTKSYHDIGKNMDCIVVAPDGMGERDIMAMTMAILMSQLGQMPRHAVKYYCKGASELFAKIAETGEVRL